MKQILTLIFVVFMQMPLFAQAFKTDTITHRQMPLPAWWEAFEKFAEAEDLDNSYLEDTYEELEELHENPIDLNLLMKSENKQGSELQKIPFLSSEQIEDILAYLYRYGEMKSLNELMMIPSLGYETRNLLQNFVCLGNKTGLKKTAGATSVGDFLKNMGKYGKHTASFTMKVPLYERAGDESAYLGDRLKHSLRYDFRYGSRVRFGIVGAKNSGEPFFGRNTAGYDHYNYYFMLKLPKYLTLALGCYKLSYGMGLVVNNNMSVGKMSLLSSLGRMDNNIRVHSSASRENYFNGLAASVNLSKRLSLSAFISNRNYDATICKDSAGISTIISSPYHRTEAEWGKKGNTNEKTAGGNISWNGKVVSLGATMLYSHLNRTLMPDSTAYRKYYPRGNDFLNMSINYGLKLNKFSFSGEVAVDNNEKLDANSPSIATVNKLSYAPTYVLHFMLLQRFYSYRYNSLYGHSFSENSDPQNESGIYLGAEWNPSKKWSFIAYTDWFYFPWYKYQVSGSSYGTDNLIQTTYTNKSLRLTARYKIKCKQKDSKIKGGLAYNAQQRLRLIADYALSNFFSLRTQGDGTLVNFEEQNYGYMLSQGVNYDDKKHFKLNCSLGYFLTDDYNSRIYAYEKSLNYSFGYSSYYGNGIRFSFYAQYYIKNKLQAAAKLGSTKYFDRDIINSSYQQINNSIQTDFEFQIIYKF